MRGLGLFILGSIILLSCQQNACGFIVTNNNTNGRGLLVSARCSFATELKGKQSDDDQDQLPEKNDNMKQTRKNNDNFKPWPFGAPMQIEDDRLVAGDVTTIFMTSFLLTLTMIIADPKFVAEGGWAAPVPVVPPHLSVSLTQASHMSISWILSSIHNRGYTLSAIRDDDSVVKSVISTWVDYCSLEIIFAILSSLSLGLPIPKQELFQELMLTLPILVGWRILYGRRIMPF